MAGLAPAAVARTAVGGSLGRQDVYSLGKVTFEIIID